MFPHTSRIHETSSAIASAIGSCRNDRWMLLYDMMVRHWSFFCTYESILVFLPLCNLFNFILTFCSWFSPPSSFCSFLPGFITSHFISSCNSLLLLLLLLLLYFSLWEDTYEGQKTILLTPVSLTYEFFVFRTILSTLLLSFLKNIFGHCQAQVQYPSSDFLYLY